MFNPEADVIPSSEIRAIARAVRFAFVALTIGFAYANIRVATSITNFQQIFHDMLGNKPLPALTQFVLDIHLVLIGLSFAWPILAIGCSFLNKLSTSIYLVGTLLMIEFIQFYFTSSVLGGPMASIIQGMQGA